MTVFYLTTRPLPARRTPPPWTQPERGLRGGAQRAVRAPAGDEHRFQVEVEEASQCLFDHGIPAFPYTTETPVEVLAAKYRWARMAGQLDGK